MSSEKTTLKDTVRKALIEKWEGRTLRELSHLSGVAENKLSMLRLGTKGVGPDALIALCKVLGIDANTGLPFDHPRATAPNEQPVEFQLFGLVEAGPPASPGESVMAGHETEFLKLYRDCWKVMFPHIDPRGLCALRVSGSSMQPRFYDGDLIFIRRTRDRSEIADGRTAIFEIPGEGMTFKIWRESGVLESVNRDAFAPRVCPKGSRLWGIVVCGTRTA